MPKISVIIPVYNGKETIKETITSVLNQTFSDIEILVINDGSTDGTLEVVDSIQDPRLNVFSYANAGLAASRNRGFALARGDYVSFMDADDLWTPDKLEAQFKALQATPQAAVAYSWTDYIDEFGHFLYPGSHVTETGDILAKLLLNNVLENGSNALIRKQALQEVGGFDESLTAAEDWDMWLRLASRYHFVAVPSAQILYRQPVHSMSANISRQETECLKVIERHFHQAPESLQHLKRFSIANLYTYLLFKVLASPLERQKSLIAARCFWQAVRHDPTLLRRRSRLMLIVLFKIAAPLILPPTQAQTWHSRLKNLSKKKMT
ncbi:MAG: glycosyltransferase [Coleofasciculus sp. A1-SPW-01]|uniref:glycosyltransferase n=1 Tax=Coleofasciculus sp. A1-SPW-01 TaxID=3070819 RepID=UPI0032F660BE